MKKLLTLPALLGFVISTQAQLIPEANQEPVNIYEIIQSFPKKEKAGTPSPDGKKIGEDKHYHDGRWLWYWRQHTDAAGNLVGPQKTFSEWKKYSSSQGRAKTTTSQANWTFQGPTSSMGGYSGVGRVNTIAFHPTQPSTYWIGSAGGGAWKTTNDGLNWAPVADHLPVLSVSDIDFNPLNPNTVYMCTGDRDSRDHYSLGVLKSYDGGQTWDTTGLKWEFHQVRLTNSLLVNPLDTNSLTLATSEGIYRSFDGGTTFNMVESGNFKQLLYHPTDTNIVYATSFFTYTNNTDAQIFRSQDGGSTWNQVTNFTDTWRIELAVTPADPSIVKAVAASRDTSYRRGLHGVYNSTNAGSSFQQIFGGHNCNYNILSGNMQGQGCTGQGNYDLCIAIHPQNPDLVFIGGVNTWRSSDGGSSFVIANQWWANLPGVAEVHADKHFLGYHPLVLNRLFEANDGGIYKTDNPFSQLWTDMTNGLGITQFYRNAVANNATYVVAGAQDNGSKILDGSSWDDVTGGDGMECQIDHWNSNIFYTSVQYGGAIYQVDGFAMNIANGPLSGLEGAWITPFLLHPLDPNILIVGYEDIYYGNSFNWTNVTNGSLGTKNILRLGISPDNPDRLYVVPEDSAIIWKFDNFSQNIKSDIAVPFPEKISDIKVDPKNSDRIWVTLSGFGTNKVAEYTSQNGWKLMNENLPDVPVNCINVDSSNGYLYIGTDVAVFYRNDTMSQWELFNTNLPVVHIMDLGINYSTDEIWAATYGRGLWKSPRQIHPVRIDEVTTGELLKVHPNPVKDRLKVQLDQRFQGQMVNCSILDQSGKLVERQNLRVGSGGTLIIEKLKLPAGVYFLNLSHKGQVIGKAKLLNQE